MESMPRDQHVVIPPWTAGTSGELVEEKAPYLEIPEGQTR
jgi:hypothetical protein